MTTDQAAAGNGVDREPATRVDQLPHKETTRRCASGNGVDREPATRVDQLPHKETMRRCEEMVCFCCSSSLTLSYGPLSLKLQPIQSVCYVDWQKQQC